MNERSTEDDDVIAQLIDSFVDQIRKGQAPSIDGFIQPYPQLGNELRQILPAIALLEQHAAACNKCDSNGQSSGPSLPSQQEIGDYMIVREIGRGGMGVVYEAVQQSLRRHVALKLLSMPALATAKHLERFRYEARAAAGLQHRNIVPVFGVGEFNGMHYYAMQFIQGKSLHEVLIALRQITESPSNKGRESRNGELNGVASADLLSSASASLANDYARNGHFATKSNSHNLFRNVARIGLQVAEALAYAHAEGVLHRDIKPSNLLLDSQGNVWVTDFGLAKVEGNDGLTETGDFVGTLRYMAPERLEGVIDRRSDIYSLGATLYELSTLQVFFENNSHAQLVDQILHETPAAPSRFERSIPRDLETIVLKAIAKEPASRYRTAEEMAEDLRRFLADRPILARRPTVREQVARWCRRNPLVATLAASVVVLLVAAVAILTYSNARIRNEVVAKDQAIASARGAVHQLLERVASEKLNNIPMSHPLRVSLLEDAVKAYDGLLGLGDTDFRTRLQLAEVLHAIAGLQRELDRYADAEAALQRSAALYDSLVEADPNPPSILQARAVTEMDLAYTWQFDTRSPDFKKFPVEDQYRRALATWDSIEQKWPERRQRVILCYRSLAAFADRRGDHVQAEKLWQQAISRGEAYLEQNAKDLQARNEICWACQEYYEAVLKNSPEKSEDAKALLAKGVRHAEVMREQSPDSVQATDVLAQLHFRQALLACRASKIDEAIPLFRKSIYEVESVCESVPWNTDYWNTTRWFHNESIRCLHAANRDDEIVALVGRASSWLRKLEKQMEDDTLSQQKMLETRTGLIKALRSIGLNSDADKLADADGKN